jgi:hypothetical protein
MRILKSSVLGKRLLGSPAFFAGTFCPYRDFTTTPQQLRVQYQQPKNTPKMTTTATTLKGQPLDRAAVDALMRRRMFYTPSFEVRAGETAGALRHT